MSTDETFFKERLRRARAEMSWIQAKTWTLLGRMHGTRPMKATQFTRGDWVLFRRRIKPKRGEKGQGGGQMKETGHWLGPARVLSIESSTISTDERFGHLITVSYNGRIWGCAPEQLTHLHPKAVAVQKRLSEDIELQELLKKAKDVKAFDLRSEAPLPGEYMEPPPQEVPTEGLGIPTGAWGPPVPPTVAEQLAPPKPAPSASSRQPDVIMEPDAVEPPPALPTPPVSAPLDPADVPVPMDVLGNLSGKRPAASPFQESSEKIRRINLANTFRPEKGSVMWYATHAWTYVAQIFTPAKTDVVEAPYLPDVALAELRHNFIDIQHLVTPAETSEDAACFHVNSTWSREPMIGTAQRAWTLSFNVDADDFEDSQGILQAVESVNMASEARRRKLEVNEKACSEEEKRAFAAAKHAEFASWISNKVVDLMVARGAPRERVIRSRWVLTFKSLEKKPTAEETKSSEALLRDGTARKAKARLVILGYQDPDLGENATWSPTLRRDTRNLLLGVIVHRGYELFTLDAHTAFLLGKQTARKLPIFVTLPKDLEEWLGAEGPRRLLKTAYGLAEAPLEWFKVLCEALLAAGFKRISSDACVFVLPGEYDPNAASWPTDYPTDYDDLPFVGIIGVHVDDLLCGGHGREWDAALAHLCKAINFGLRKFTPLTYCGVDYNQDAKTKEIFANQAAFCQTIEEPSAKSSDWTQALRQCCGSLIWPAHQTRPDLCFDVSWLGSRVVDPNKEDIAFAQKLVRRAKAHAQTGLTYKRIVDRWGEVVIVTFSDAGWATRQSGHSQAANMIFLANPAIAEGYTAHANLMDYSSGKISLTVKSSYDAELHACSDAAVTSESLQASLSELSTWLRYVAWTCTTWLHQGPTVRVPLLIVIDAKGLWTKIQAEHKTEKRGLIYVRCLMENLKRTGGLVFWVNSGHMACDGLTKRSDKKPEPALELLYYILETNCIRITYCEDSWRRELTKRAREKGVLKQLTLQDPLEWNPPEDIEFETHANRL